MYTNQNFCTVYQQTVEAESRTEIYQKHVIFSNYWQESRGQRCENKSRSPEDVALCIIPETSLNGYFPQKDDLICCGLCESAQPPENCLTIIQVNYFLYGSHPVRHIEVTAI